VPLDALGVRDRHGHGPRARRDDDRRRRRDVGAGTPLPNGCRLSGSTADGQALIEAAVLDLGGGGVALAILLHKSADDGAGPVFQRVVASMRRP
jgi:hypothetical protein